MQLALVRKVVGDREIERVFRLTFVAADNYTPGGVTLDFTKALNPNSLERPLMPAFVGDIPVSGVSAPSNAPANSANFQVDQEPNGYAGEVIRNSVSPTLKNYLFKISTQGGTEHGTSLIAAGIYNDANGFTFSCVTPKKYG